MSVTVLRRWRGPEREMPPGHWHPIADEDPEDRDDFRAIIACPECGKLCALKHNVDAAGNVTPSMVCPHKPCEWHVYGRLDEWGSP